MASRSTRALLLAVYFGGLSLSLAAKWSYEGAAGPQKWHELFPHACSGSHQSPINIRAEETMYSPDLKEFALWYDPPKPDSKLYVKNSGYTLQVDLEGEFYVTNGGLSHVYKAAQFHFHWGHKVHVGSEHLMEGEHSPIELHLVTYNQDRFPDLGSAVTEKGGLAVLGVMFEISPDDNPVLDPIVRAIKHIKDPETKTRISLPLISLRDLLPDDISRYFRYNGSLTTPGCFESVTWTVFDKKQTISREQMREFRSLLKFRRKHHHHHKTNGATDSRHKRSLSHAEHHKERLAENVLDELGIRGDQFDEDVFRAELTEKKLEDVMFSDMPKATMESTENKNDDSKNHEEPSSSETKYKAVESKEPEVKVVLEEEMKHYTQDILVNNYRPVQPLNNRVIYRSFKLRDPASADHDHPAAEHDHPPPDCVETGQTGASHDHGKGGNSAGPSGGRGFLAAMSCVFLSLLLSLQH